METPQTAAEAWGHIINYALHDNATVETAFQNQTNYIGVEQGQMVLTFQTEDGQKRRVTRTEFETIWEQFRTSGTLTRQTAGEKTADWAGAALFGTVHQLFDFELTTSTSPSHLQFG